MLLSNRANVNPLSPNLHIQILHTDIHTDIQRQPLRESKRRPRLTGTKIEKRGYCIQQLQNRVNHVPCLLCFVLQVVLSCIRQESANKRYRSTMKDLLLPNSVSQSDEKPHTAGLDDTAIPHIKIEITEIP